MYIEQSILKNTRAALGLAEDANDFDIDLIMHINAAIGTLNQNGVGRPLVVKDESQIWSELQDPLQIKGNEYFHMIPLFVTLSTKLIFDPPPPSTVEVYRHNIDQLLWRLKIAYEEPIIIEGGDIYA